MDDPDISQRIAATSNVRVDAYQLGALADHAQPVIVRRAVARLLRPGIAECAAADPSPAVRQMALGGWDLPDAVRQRLMADPAVLLARLLLSYPGPQTEVSA